MTFDELREQINRSNEYSSRLGLVVTSIDENGAKAELPVREAYHNPFHTVHGGILFTVADVTGGVAAFSGRNNSVLLVKKLNLHIKRWTLPRRGKSLKNQYNIAILFIFYRMARIKLLPGRKWPCAAAYRPGSRASDSFPV